MAFESGRNMPKIQRLFGACSAWNQGDCLEATNEGQRLKPAVCGRLDGTTEELAEKMANFGGVFGLFIFFRSEPHFCFIFSLSANLFRVCRDTTPSTYCA